MKLENYYPNKRVRLMFQDEAGFGRINKPKYCWCNEKILPTVPCHHIREYRYVYAAVEPKTGENFFLVMPNCNTDCMNVFINELSSDVILLNRFSKCIHIRFRIKVVLICSINT